MTLPTRFLLATGLVMTLLAAAPALASAHTDPLNAKPASNQSYEKESDDPEKSDLKSYEDEDEKSSELKSYDKERDGKGSLDADEFEGGDDEKSDDANEKKTDLKSYDKEKKVNDTDFSDRSSKDKSSQQ